MKLREPKDTVNHRKREREKGVCVGGGGVVRGVE